MSTDTVTPHSAGMRFTINLYSIDNKMYDTDYPCWLPAQAWAASGSETSARKIRESLFFAFVYNVAGVPIAADVLYPSFSVVLSPIIAAAAMALSSVSVIANSLRLRAVRL